MHQSLRNLVIFSFFVLAVSASSEPPSFKCPTYIDTVVPSGQNRFYGKREPGDPFLANMQDVHATLSKCSNITSLKLRVTGLGCSEWPDRWSFPFDLRSGSHYPSKLEALDLEGYQFNDSPWAEVQESPVHSQSVILRNLEWAASERGWKWLKWLTLSQEQKAKTSLDLWLDAMDFRHIKTLSLRLAQDHRPNLERLIPHLKSLRSLAVSGTWAKDLILGLPENSLTHLSWISSGETGESVQPALLRHAQSLTSLEWREPESEYRQRKVMSAEQIAEVGRAIPGLQSISLDINRNGTWPTEHFEALATNFPKVKNMTIFLEFASECRRQLETSKLGVVKNFHRYDMERKTECKGRASMAQPLLNNHRAEKVFDFLREKKVGDELTKVVFYAGDWQRPWDGPLAESTWLESRKAFYLCEVTDEPVSWDIAGSGHTRCDGLNTELVGDHHPGWGEDLAKRARNFEL